MFKQSLLTAAIAVALVAISCPQKLHAEQFKSSDFLTWGRDNRSWYLEVSVTMAASVASQNVKGQSACIYEWYFRNGEVNPRREKQIFDAMRSNPQYHPHAVILAVLQKACGSFSYKSQKQ